MTDLRIVQLADLHIGGACAPAYVDGLEAAVPALEPDLLVIAGDLTQRARHGEFLAALSVIRRMAGGRPVHVLPGNHDVQWWWRPLIPFGHAAIYRKYHKYFGENLVSTIELPGAIVTGVLTSHGLSWGSLTLNPRDLAVKGHLPAAEVRRATGAFTVAPAEAARVLVLHHNVLRGPRSGRMGLARWRQAQRRLIACEPDVILCGHDHEERADLLDGRVVVSTTGTISNHLRGTRPPVFNVVEVAPDRIRVIFHRWNADEGGFRASDVHAFARHRTTGGRGEGASQGV
jgi:3',5'-cyclic AMP phosphodiesterase CpdA